MIVRVAAALVLLPACASGLASPIGALTGPFVVPVLAQQRQAAARDHAAQPKPDQAGPACQDGRAAKTDGHDAATAKPLCQAPFSDEVAARSRSGADPLPEPERKPSSN